MRKTKAFYLYAVRPVRTTGLLQQCIILCFYFQFLEGFGGHIHNIMTKSMSLFICIWQETKNKKVIFIILVRQVLQRPSLYFHYSLTMDDTKRSAPLCKKREASIHIHWRGKVKLLEFLWYCQGSASFWPSVFTFRTRTVTGIPQTERSDSRIGLQVEEWAEENLSSYAIFKRFCFVCQMSFMNS